MEQIPEFWRTEVWHPVSVHLPLVVLVLAAVFALAGLLTKRKFWTHASYLLLIIGTIGAWIAIYTGNLADGVVGRNLCDPTVLEDHENAAYTASWLFTAASLAAIIDFSALLSKFRRWFMLLSLLLMLSGSYFIISAGHLGATLVYQQAAGVYIPSENCSEFE